MTKMVKIKKKKINSVNTNGFRTGDLLGKKIIEDLGALLSIINYKLSPKEKTILQSSIAIIMKHTSNKNT